MGNCLPTRRGQRQRAIWQVEEEPATSWHGGMWLDFSPPWNSMLEAAYQCTRLRPYMCHTVELEDYESGWIEYEVDLRTFIQTSNRSGAERRVRRVMAGP